MRSDAAVCISIFSSFNNFFQQNTLHNIEWKYYYEQRIGYDVEISDFGLF